MGQIGQGFYERSLGVRETSRPEGITHKSVESGLVGNHRLLQGSIDEQFFDACKSLRQIREELPVPTPDGPAEHQADSFCLLAKRRGAEGELFTRSQDVLFEHFVEIGIQHEEAESMGMAEEMQCGDECGGLSELSGALRWGGALSPSKRVNARCQRLGGEVT